MDSTDKEIKEAVERIMSDMDIVMQSFPDFTIHTPRGVITANVSKTPLFHKQGESFFFYPGLVESIPPETSERTVMGDL